MEQQQLEKKLDRHIWLGEDFPLSEVKILLGGISREDCRRLKLFVNIQRDLAEDYATHPLTGERGEKAIKRCRQLESVFSEDLFQNSRP